MTSIPASHQIVEFHVPASSREPMPVKVKYSEFRMVLVNRESVKLLDKSWCVLGVYVLLGNSGHPDKLFGAYVGEVGKRDFVTRVKEHADKKQWGWWSRALLIASPNSDFNSAAIGWLEGRLYDVLHNAVACDVKNVNRPGDNSLPALDRDIMEKYVEPIMVALRACGAPPDTHDQEPVPKGKKVTKFSESVLDLIQAGLLKPDTVLVPLRKSVAATATVRSDGHLEVNGSDFGSLSAAAKHASGTRSEAGWDFWGAPSGKGGFVPLAELRSRLREEKGSAERAPRGPEERDKAKPATRKSAGGANASLQQVIAAAGIALPLPIFAKYRGSHVEAVIETDGFVRMGEKRYTSPSLAGAAAKRAHGYGGAGKAATNGWVWWSFKDSDGSVKLLNDMRKLTPMSRASEG